MSWVLKTCRRIERLNGEEDLIRIYTPYHTFVLRKVEHPTYRDGGLKMYYYWRSTVFPRRSSRWLYGSVQFLKERSSRSYRQAVFNLRDLLIHYLLENPITEDGI